MEYEGNPNYAREAMGKTPEDLFLWAIGTHDNPFRQDIAKLEFERRVAAAQIETARATKWSARWMLASVLVLAATGVGSVAIQYLAWMVPHLPK